jgi:hypothetical protein
MQKNHQTIQFRKRNIFGAIQNIQKPAILAFLKIGIDKDGNLIINMVTVVDQSSKGACNTYYTIIEQRILEKKEQIDNL